MAKYIFVTGGVVSGLGKGITAASLGRLLKCRGLKIAAQKLDPYINVDPGTMSPYQHGEVFVTDDGSETDLDLGHYERFIDEDLNRYSNLTSGRVYWNVLNKERRGEYLGQTVQVIPHITQEIKDFIYRLGEKTEADIIITEIGGTTGDMESQPFLEAARQIGLEQGKGNTLFIHVKLEPEIFHKIAMFCNVKTDCVIENMTLPDLYEAPLMLEEQGFSHVVCRELGLETDSPDLSEWRIITERNRSPEKSVNIGLVGKYVQLHDAYLSVAEALRHAGGECGAKVDISWIDSGKITEENVAEMLSGCDGIIMPGGFGSRGIPGMISAVRYVREKNIPFLGLCLGMQIAVIEFARHVCGLDDADSGEFAPDSGHKVIDFLPDQSNETDKGGTLRLGAYPCRIMAGSLMESCYKSDLISERHRHRYEFNNDYREILSENGMRLCGISPDGKIVEAIELPAQKFFIGVQFHPEFKSRPNRAHPLFLGLIKASIEAGEE